MNTLVLLVEAGSGWSPETWATEHGGIRGVGSQITIERGAQWLSVVRDDRVLDDFDEEERSRLGKLVTEPAAYLIEWTGSVLVENLLRSIPPETCAAVDNDHGLIVPFHDIADEPLDSWVRASSLP